MKVKGVLFDLYETLISEYADGARKVNRASQDYRELIGLPSDEFRKEWGRRQEMRMTGTFPDYYSVMKDIIEKRNLECEDKILDSLYQERVYEKSVPFLDIPDEIFEMLECVKKKGIKLGLISNCTEEEVQAWNSSKLAGYFDEVIFSFQVGYAKPNPKIYELACSRLGVNANDCIFVGDGGSNELDGASEAGMYPFQATWYVPEEYMSNRTTKHKKLIKPLDIMKQL
ncbi:HAD family hydrolase [Paenibacillus tarimensis]